MTDGLNCGTIWLYIYPEEVVWFKSLQSHVEIIVYPTKPDAGFHCSKDYFLYARLYTHKGVCSWGLSVLNPSQHEINIDKWYSRISSTSHKPQFLLMTIKKIFKPEWAGLIIHAATFYWFQLVPKVNKNNLLDQRRSHSFRITGFSFFDAQYPRVRVGLV